MNNTDILQYNKGESFGIFPSGSPLFLLFKKQQIFHLSSSFNARNYLAFIAAERNVLLVNVPVPGFKFLYQLAFWKVFAA